MSMGTQQLLPITVYGHYRSIFNIGVLQMNTVGVLQLLNFRRNIFIQNNA